MEYIFSTISLVFTSFLLSLYALLGVPIGTHIETTSIQGTTTALVTSVIDGDTIDVVIEGTKNAQRVRYIGIDTPEPYAEKVPECGSKEATTRNKQLVDGQTIILVPGTDPYDTYDRLLAYVYVGDTFVNETLIAEGYASLLMLKPNTQYESRFSALYVNAKTEQIGIWSTCE